MKVVQLGCGITGLVCAEHLTKNEKVDEVVLADAWTDAAESMMRRVNSGKLSVKKADAKDVASVKSILKGADLVVSAIPWMLNLPVLRTAADCGVDYVDFSMSMDSEKEFDEISALCESAGTTALTSMGADPGISDVMAVHAAKKLDSPETARVMDGDTGSVEGHEWFTLWSPLEMLEEMTVPAAVYKDGEIEYLPPLHERQLYEFPEPIGVQPVYNTTHEETWLIPRHVKGLRYADFRIAIDDNTAMTANVLRKIGLHGMKPVDVKGQKVAPIDVVTALMPRPVELIGKVRGHAGIVVEVTGESGGRRMLSKAWTTMSHEKAYELFHSNATGYLVGTGGATGAEMIIDGLFDEKGLFIPEQLPTEEFLKRLQAKHLEVRSELVPA